MVQTVPRPAAACPEGSPTDRYTAVTRVLTDQQHILRLSPRQFQLVVHLLSFKWFEDSPIIPSVPTLARQMACSDRTVQRAADGLAGKGVLTVRERYRSDGGRTSNEYRLAPWLLACVTPCGDRGDTSPRTRSSPGPVTRVTYERPGVRTRSQRTTRYERRPDPPQTTDYGATSRGYSLSRLRR